MALFVAGIDSIHHSQGNRDFGGVLLLPPRGLGGCPRKEEGKDALQVSQPVALIAAGSTLGAAERFAPSHAARKTLRMCALECERWIEVLPHFVDHSDLARGWKVISSWRIV